MPGPASGLAGTPLSVLLLSLLLAGCERPVDLPAEEAPVAEPDPAVTAAIEADLRNALERQTPCEADGRCGGDVDAELANLREAAAPTANCSSLCLSDDRIAAEEARLRDCAADPAWVLATLGPDVEVGPDNVVLQCDFARIEIDAHLREESARRMAEQLPRRPPRVRRRQWN